MHIRSIEVAQFHLDTWAQITEKCQELEALRCGDGARERMERLALQKRVVELHLKVEQLQEVLTGAQHAWKRQVHDCACFPHVECQFKSFEFAHHRTKCDVFRTTHPHVLKICRSRRWREGIGFVCRRTLKYEPEP